MPMSSCRRGWRGGDSTLIHVRGENSYSIDSRHFGGAMTTAILLPVETIVRRSFALRNVAAYPCSVFPRYSHIQMAAQESVLQCSFPSPSVSGCHGALSSSVPDQRGAAYPVHQIAGAALPTALCSGYDMMWQTWHAEATWKALLSSQNSAEEYDDIRLPPRIPLRRPMRYPLYKRKYAIFCTFLRAGCC